MSARSRAPTLLSLFIHFRSTWQPTVLLQHLHLHRFDPWPLVVAYYAITGQAVAILTPLFSPGLGMRAVPVVSERVRNCCQHVSAPMRRGQIPLVFLVPWNQFVLWTTWGNPCRYTCKSKKIHFHWVLFNKDLWFKGYSLTLWGLFHGFNPSSLFVKKYLYNLTASKFMHHLFQDNLCYQNICTIAMSRECIESFVSIKKKEKKLISTSS